MTDRKLWRTGASACFFGRLDESVLEEYAKADVKSTEMSFRNPYFDEIEWKSIPRWVQNTGTEIWSIHLPFDRTLNIATFDKEMADATVTRHLDLIGRAGEIGVKVVVIHPSTEPNAEKDRPALLDISAENLGKLCARAKEFGMVVAVEDLPRTCLGNCTEEIQYLLDHTPDLRVCFDTNHLLKDTSHRFIRTIADKIVTLHVSDYDFVNEKHVFPGQGLIDWKQLQEDLEAVDYNGPFMYELGPRDIDGQRTLTDLKANHRWLASL